MKTHDTLKRLLSQQCDEILVLGQHCLLSGTLPRPQTSEEGGGGHHEQYSPHLQYQVSDDQEGANERSQTKE